jgi:hypothetical protein
MQDLLSFAFGSISVAEALTVAVASFVGGYLVTYGNRAQAKPVFLMQLWAVSQIIRYVASYLVYGETLRDGWWSIVWALAAIGGVWAAETIERRRGHVN